MGIARRRNFERLAVAEAVVMPNARIAIGRELGIDWVDDGP